LSWWPLSQAYAGAAALVDEFDAYDFDAHESLREVTQRNLSPATSWADFHKPAVAFRRLFPGRSLRPSKADAFTCPVFVNELDSGSFKRLPNGSFVRGRNGDLSVNHFHTADRCDPDF